MDITNIQNREEIINYISTLKDPAICEVGSRDGRYFYESLFASNCKLGIIVDIWRDTGDLNQNDIECSQEELNYQYKTVFKKTLNYFNVKIIREFSDKASDFFDDETFDFIYIDADHSYRGCLTDLNCWYPKVKEGGILAGHDYISPKMSIEMGHKTVFGVVQAVDDFLTKNNSSYLIHVTPETYGTYFIRKGDTN
jgi:hypothetical protein